ncbi:PREDICTED: odorant receptor 13a-like isoform X1 [Polistes dominula]|uniref:Odorant receptor n=1 Tax=Polistes dominula TaxID=743375 RepID=A0ABM1ISE5_POLDO|nr:PREDICTED: odorant receptor 13a-like isoform X1 [Polistes dominula]
MSIHRVWQVEYACGWNIYTLKFIGIWPEERRLDRLSSYKVLIGIAFIIIFCTIPQYWLLYIERHDFNLIMENLSLDIINGTVGFIKMMFFWSSGGQIKDLLTAMEEDWKEVSTKEDEEKMMKYATFSRKIATRATIICYSIIAFYTAQRILSMRTLGRLTYFPSYYPIETMDSPLFELKFIGQMIAATYYSVTYSSVDTFLVTLILHVCGQLKRLQNQLVHLDIGTSQEFQNKLSYIIRRHDYLNKFIETIEDQFNIMLLFQILSCILQLCLECFQELTLMVKEGEKMPLIEIFFFGVYILFVLLQLYLYCYVGEKLWTESTEVARAAYECNWYNLLPHEARSLILIIRRSRSPLRLTAGKFCTLNHELYSSVLKTSMGYLSVLRATMTSDE